MKLQIISDIHLELLGKFPPLTITGDYLALCGDIGYPKSEIYHAFLKYVAENYKGVFVIAGNHEYYNSKTVYLKMKDKIKTVCSEFKNVYFLDNDRIEIDDYVILGTTLWSFIPDFAVREIVNGINDYAKIKYFDPFSDRKRTITPMMTNQWHETAVAWLKENIEAAANKKVIVLTHHAPLTTGTSERQYEGKVFNHAFATDLAYLLKPPVVLWAFGHTHYCVDREVNGVKLVSNQLGYSDETTGYDASWVVEV